MLFAVALVVLASACLDPSDRRAGLRLSGEVVSDLPSDWSFSDAHPEIYVEVRTPYLLPHSVTIVCATLDGRLYVGARNPDTKNWVSYVDRDDEVRLKIGDQVYEVRLERVTEGDEVEAVVGGYARKYRRPPGDPAKRPTVWYWRVLPRSG